MRPHAHLDRQRSAAEMRRIALGLTLEHAAQLTGGRLSRSAWHRLESLGRGSLQAWQLVATILGATVEEIRSPARGNALEGQLVLWPASSS